MEDFQTTIIIYLIVPGLTLLLTISSFPTSFYIYMLFLTVEGLIKLFANFHPVAHLSRNILMLGLLHSYIRTARRDPMGRLFPPLRGTGLVMLFIAVLLLEALHPQSISWRTNVAAWKVHLEFIPLFFMGYAVVSDERLMRRIFGLLNAAALLIGGLAIMELVFGAQRVMSWGPGFSHPVMVATELAPDGTPFIRPFGTSSSAGGSGVWAAILLPLLLTDITAAPSALGKSSQPRMVTWAGLTSCCLTLFISFARQTFAAALLSVPICILLIRRYTSLSRRMLGLILFISLTLLALRIADGITNGAVSYRFASSWQDPIDTYRDSRWHSLKWVPYHALNSPFGRGLGLTAASSFTMSGSEYFMYRDIRGGVDTEVYPLCIIWDAGLVGLILISLIYLSLFRLAAWNRSGISDSSLQTLNTKLAASLFVIFLLCFGQAALTSFPCSAFFWLFGGMLASIPYVYAQRIGAWSDRPAAA